MKLFRIFLLFISVFGFSHYALAWYPDYDKDGVEHTDEYSEWVEYGGFVDPMKLLPYERKALYQNKCFTADELAGKKQVPIHYHNEDELFYQTCACKAIIGLDRPKLSTQALSLYDACNKNQYLVMEKKQADIAEEERKNKIKAELGER